MIITQYIITFTIVLGAFSVAGYRFVRFFTDPIQKYSGCGSDCSGCAVDELKKTIEGKNAKTS